MNRLIVSTLVYLLSALILSPSLIASVKGEEVTYKADGVELKGYLATDDAVEGQRPGVLVVHEWWGHNEYARRRARMLAEMGYTALAVDMYGDGKTADHPDNAAKFSGEVMKNQEVARGRFLAALAALKGHATVDPGRVAAIGYCFGGGVVLAMARSGIDLDGVVSFHGSLPTTTPARPGEVKARILVCHGADDPFVPGEQIEAFKKEMKAAGADLTFKTHEGAVHSFTNPDADRIGEKFNLPLSYNEKADTQSWADMKEFFDRIFKDQ